MRTLIRTIGSRLVTMVLYKSAEMRVSLKTQNFAVIVNPETGIRHAAGKYLDHMTKAVFLIHGDTVTTRNAMKYLRVKR